MLGVILIVNGFGVVIGLGGGIVEVVFDRFFL